MTAVGEDLGLVELYEDLHQHPELSFQETRTAEIVADRLAALGFETTTGVGGTGVVGVMRNGDGPTALLRADMDALPVLEQTGLPYASEQRGTDRAGDDVPVMHACGHDVHVTCLLGAAAVLAGDRDAWAGTAMLVFQPAEELGEGAQAMVDDALFDRCGTPDVVLGQHVAPFPAGTVAVTAGPAFAAAESLRVTMVGRGGHGSRPETTVDPVVMAAATVMRLQTIVSRETAATGMAVVTVGALRAGTKDNIIPDSAELLVNVRSIDPRVHERVLASIHRIVRAEAAAAGAPREPVVESIGDFPVLVNDEEAVVRTSEALASVVGEQGVLDPGLVTGSEDVGVFGTAAGVPTVYWLLGGADPVAFVGAATADDLAEVTRGLPSNHSAEFAPVVEPTLRVGVSALVAAAHAWLPGASR